MLVKIMNATIELSINDDEIIAKKVSGRKVSASDEDQVISFLAVTEDKLELICDDPKQAVELVGDNTGYYATPGNNWLLGEYIGCESSSGNNSPDRCKNGCSDAMVQAIFNFVNHHIPITGVKYQWWK